MEDLVRLAVFILGMTVGLSIAALIVWYTLLSKHTGERHEKATK